LKEMMSHAIMECSKHYNFDGEEACRMLDLDSVMNMCGGNSRGSRGSRGSGPRESRVSRKEKKEKPSILLPFNGVQDMSCCQGLRQNHGLYTQCQIARKEDGKFCKVCQSQADKNGGLPDYGTIDERMKCHQEGVEFKDPSGKSPVAYSIVMKKLKLTKQQVEEEAGKFNIILNPNHFVEVASKKSGRPPKADKKEKGESKPKGRPKKSKKVLELAGEEEDLFASLVMSANKQDVSEEEDEIESNDDSIEEQVAPLIEEKKETKKEPKKKVSEEEKEAAKAAKEAEKEAAKAAKEAEKEAAKAAKEAEKAAKKAEKGAKKVEKKAEKVEKKATQNESQEDDEEADVVKKIEFEGKKYLKSKKTGIVYNMEQDVIGKWNESKQRIEFNEVDEEIADEYEE
jgi:hypothetical protein